MWLNCWIFRAGQGAGAGRALRHAQRSHKDPGLTPEGSWHTTRHTNEVVYWLYNPTLIYEAAQGFRGGNLKSEILISEKGRLPCP